MKLLSTYSEFLLDFLLDCKILKNKSIRSPMLRSCKALRNLLGSRMSLSEHFQVRKLERVVCSNISGFEYSIHKVNHLVSHSYLLSLKSFLVQRSNTNHKTYDKNLMSYFCVRQQNSKSCRVQRLILAIFWRFFIPKSPDPRFSSDLFGKVVF